MALSTMEPLMLPYTAWAFAGAGLHASAQARSRTDVRTSEIMESVQDRKPNGSLMRCSSRKLGNRCELARIVTMRLSRVKRDCGRQGFLCRIYCSRRC